MVPSESTAVVVGQVGLVEDAHREHVARAHGGVGVERLGRLERVLERPRRARREHRGARAGGDEDPEAAESGGRHTPDANS